MPRSFDMAADYDGTVEQIHHAFGDERYWLARLASSGADTTTLDAITAHADGGVDVITTQTMRADRLPGVVSQFHRGDLRFVREETWTPVSDGHATAVVSGTIPGAPATLTGSAVLASTGAGARLEFMVTVEVRIPLVGGKVENFVGSYLQDLLHAEQRFTTAWIRRTPDAALNSLAMGALQPVGQLTRGTTGYNRLRRSDRWLVHAPPVRAALLSATTPLVVDLGYGALPVTTLELAARLRPVRPDVRVVGLEIHPERVVPSQGGVDFALGGFELAGLQPILVRAFNVLRQYHVDEVADAWTTMRSHLAPGGLIVDGTCDELGRRCCWVLLDEWGPVSLTLACDPFAIEKPSDLAERLPKVLIHHNVAGQPIHRLLTAADRAWAAVAGHGVFGPRVRWRAMLESLAADGHPVEPPRRRLRDGVLTVPWEAVAPA